MLSIPPGGVDSNADSNGCSEVQNAELIGEGIDGSPCDVVAGVAVDVASDRVRGVAEEVGHGLDVHAGL